MKLNKLKEIKEEDLKNTNVGFAFTSMLSGISLLVSSLSSIVGLLKSAFSSSGEIKDKTNTYKWNYETKSSNSSKNNITIF
ncbi:hypothetical protein [Mycoplasmopsis felis]|uniref:hypothetical protein n=1 Tax=Mycoplasmopsis felis TaxID=33923 RepID=UPI002AFED6FA|nr:hypothetical protein [Mycoplasmopsis felis]WQQ03361.1 hypothetical protein RRG38_00660 [Mycoplasmopsis felis]WQQ05005.1 hypothetical protein RRG55_01635 [Mycoplasmopsis felis]